MKSRHADRQRHIGAALCAAMWLGCVAGRGAESSSAPGPVSAPGAAPGSSIEEARREFEAIKAARDPAQRPSGASPSFSVPELQTGSSEPKPWISSKATKPEVEARKSENWLVDAMAKETRRRVGSDRDGSGRRERDPAADRTEPGDDELGSLAAQGSDAARSERETLEKDRARNSRDRDEISTVANPLTRYLDEWMTPRDYAILKPGLDDSWSGPSNPGAPDVGALNNALLPGSVAGLAGSVFGVDGPRGPAFVVPEVHENPYLEVFNAPPSNSAPGPAFAPPSLPASTAVQVPVSAGALLPAGPTKSKIPEFVPPAHDQKYFKQLKRF